MYSSKKPSDNFSTLYFIKEQKKYDKMKFILALPPTLIGIMALLFWASASLLIVLIGSLPVFEMQSLLFLISFLLALIVFKKSLFTALKKIPVKLMIIAILGLFGTNTFYLWAFHYAAPEKVALINYTWPIWIIIFSYFVNHEKITVKHLLGAVISFFGIYVLLSKSMLGNGFNLLEWRGYLLSFMSALCWSYFTVQIRKHQAPLQIIGIAMGFSMLLTLFIHLGFEEFVWPSFKQGSLLFMLGFISQGIAYYFWQWGINKGNFRLLTLLSFFYPILSIALLVWFGFAKTSINLLIACAFVTIGSFVALYNRRKSKS